MKTKRMIVVSTIALLLTAGVAGPAFAEPDPIQASTPGAPSVDGGNDDVVAKLNALKGTQSEKEVDSILNSGSPAEGLFDPLAGKWLAAYYTEPLFSTQAIGISGPGCASTDACAITSNGIPNGFYGTGQLNNAVNNVAQFYAGNRTTTWYYGTSGLFLRQQPNVGAKLTTTVNMYAIARS